VGDEGVLISSGGIDGGYSLFVKTARCAILTTMWRAPSLNVESNVTVPAGRHQLRYEFEVTGKPEILKGKGAPGRGQL
jgi:hypothetical protein